MHYSHILTLNLNSNASLAVMVNQRPLRFVCVFSVWVVLLVSLHFLCVFYCVSLSLKAASRGGGVYAP